MHRASKDATPSTPTKQAKVEARSQGTKWGLPTTGDRRSQMYRLSAFLLVSTWIAVYALGHGLRFTKRLETGASWQGVWGSYPGFSVGLHPSRPAVPKHARAKGRRFALGTVCATVWNLHRRSVSRSLPLRGLLLFDASDTSY